MHEGEHTDFLETPHKSYSGEAGAGAGGEVCLEEILDDFIETTSEAAARALLSTAVDSDGTPEKGTTAHECPRRVCIAACILNWSGYQVTQINGDDITDILPDCDEHS